MFNRHLVKNFPKKTPFWKKIIANIMFHVGSTKITNRGQLLTQKDYRKVKKNIKEGDIILVGCLTKINSLFVKSPITHAAIYTGHGNFVHSVADGVLQGNLSEIFEDYDTIIVIRPVDATRKQIRQAIDFAKKQIGKPYDFYFSHKENNYYCSHLIYECLRQAGISTNLFQKRDAVSLTTKILNIKVIHPIQYIQENFKIIYKSDNIKLANRREVQFIDDRSILSFDKFMQLINF